MVSEIQQNLSKKIIKVPLKVGALESTNYNHLQDKTNLFSFIYPV